MEPYDALHSFRRSFYECLQRRADALFELTDAAILDSDAVPSPVHLSLQASHRRVVGAASMPRWTADGSMPRRCVGCSPLICSPGAGLPYTPWT
jgi:hypothetical protein